MRVRRGWRRVEVRVEVSGGEGGGEGEEKMEVRCEGAGALRDQPLVLRRWRLALVRAH